ncbi:MAG: hypothetical protein L0177_16885 [Chloroflexi bacterium]|nr:hypothetical protein [Chloroflexota bacterium]
MIASVGLTLFFGRNAPVIVGQSPEALLPTCTVNDEIIPASYHYVMTPKLLSQVSGIEVTSTAARASTFTYFVFDRETGETSGPFASSLRITSTGTYGHATKNEILMLPQTFVATLTDTLEVSTPQEAEADPPEDFAEVIEGFVLSLSEFIATSIVQPKFEFVDVEDVPAAVATPIASIAGSISGVLASVSGAEENPGWTNDYTYQTVYSVTKGLEGDEVTVTAPAMLEVDPTIIAAFETLGERFTKTLTFPRDGIFVAKTADLVNNLALGNAQFQDDELDSLCAAPDGITYTVAYADFNVDPAAVYGGRLGNIDGSLVISNSAVFAFENEQEGQQNVYILDWTGGRPKALTLKDPLGIIFTDTLAAEPPLVLPVADADPGLWTFQVMDLGLLTDTAKYALVVATGEEAAPEPQEPVIINESLELIDVDTAYNPTPVSGFAGGVFTVTPTWLNTSDPATSFFDVFAQVAILEGSGCPCAVLNADGGPGGVAANVSLTDSLAPGETVAKPFDIGLSRRAPFSFFVNVLGVTGD